VPLYDQPSTTYNSEKQILPTTNGKGLIKAHKDYAGMGIILSCTVELVAALLLFSSTNLL
jgi:hypothetical protein